MAGDLKSMLLSCCFMVKMKRVKARCSNSCVVCYSDSQPGLKRSFAMNRFAAVVMEVHCNLNLRMEKPFDLSVMKTKDGPLSSFSRTEQQRVNMCCRNS